MSDAMSTEDTSKEERIRRKRFKNRFDEIPEDAQTHMHLGRRRRCRVPYSKEMLDILERAYADDVVPVGKAGRGPKEALAVQTGLTYYQIDKWFDNRRIKEKKLANRQKLKEERADFSSAVLGQHPFVDPSMPVLPTADTNVASSLTAGVAASDGAVLLAETCVPLGETAGSSKDLVTGKAGLSSPLAVVVDMETAAQQLVALDLQLHVTSAFKLIHKHIAARHVFARYGCSNERVPAELYNVDVEQLVTEVRAPLDVIGSMGFVLVAGQQNDTDRNNRQSLATMLAGKLKAFTEALVSSAPPGFVWRGESLEMYDILFHTTWPLVLAALLALLPIEDVTAVLEFCIKWDTRYGLTTHC